MRKLSVAAPTIAREYFGKYTNILSETQNTELYVKNSFRSWSMVGFAFVALAGTLLHFAYEWSGNSPIAAIFSGVNESIWEHMKLLFMPMFFFAIVESRAFTCRSDFWWIQCVGILFGLTAIPVLFCTYNGTIGTSPAWFNIAIFFVAAFSTYALEVYLFENQIFRITKYPAIFAMLLMLSLFIAFTFRTPRLEIFRDPLTNSYGASF